MMNRDAIVYGIIIIACVAIVTLSSMQDFGKSRTVHELYLSTYPNQVAPAENISFSVIVENNNKETFQYVLGVLVDGEEKQKRQITIQADSKTTEEFTLEQNFGPGESHKITTILYSEGMDPESYASVNHPYYIFFNVDVV